LNPFLQINEGIFATKIKDDNETLRLSLEGLNTANIFLLKMRGWH
jgi:hypothetical protein